MVSSYISNKIVSALDAYVEDFTANDIHIDLLKGRIEKNNVKLRSNALELLMPTPTPLEIVQGYIKKLLIEVPITRILYEPVIITVEDMHIIIKSSERYDRQFVKRVLLSKK